MEPIEGEHGDDLAIDETESQDAVFKSEEEMRESLSRLCYGDLYTIGLIWIHALKTVLVGAKFSLIPVVEAAKPPEPPKRPPKMRYKDLPIYDSPHYEYKEHVASKDGCPGANTKLFQKALYPCVKKLRQQSAKAMCQACCGIRSTYRDVAISIDTSKKDFKKMMRDPDNLQMRQGVLAGGTLTGFLLGGGGGIPRRTFFTSLGALAAGSLCFPKETDEVFRNVAYNAAKSFLAVYNGLCRKNYGLRERLPCKDELPPEPKPRKLLCPPKK